MLRSLVVLVVLVPASPALALDHDRDDQSEPVRVAIEACGPGSDLHCLEELRKVCHAHPTFRCYYSRKARIDAIRQVGFPDDRARGRDE